MNKIIATQKPLFSKIDDPDIREFDIMKEQLIARSQRPKYLPMTPEDVAALGESINKLTSN